MAPQLGRNPCITAAPTALTPSLFRILYCLQLPSLLASRPSPQPMNLVAAATTPEAPAAPQSSMLRVLGAPSAQVLWVSHMSRHGLPQRIINELDHVLGVALLVWQ